MLREEYNGCVSRLPSELQNTPSGVLFSCVLSVISNNASPKKMVPKSPREGEEAEVPKNDYDLMSASNIISSEGQHVDIAAEVSESGGGSNGIFQSLFAEDKSDRLFCNLCQVVNQNRGEVYMSECDNSFLVRIVKGLTSIKQDESKQEPLHNFIQNLVKFEQQAIIRRQVMRLLEDQTMPLKPAMSQVERGIKETELLSFSDYSTTDLYRSNQLQEIEEMLQKYSKAIANFTGHLKLSGGGDNGSVLKRK